MRTTLVLLFLLSFEATAQIRVRLNYDKRWLLTTPDSAVFIRVGIYDTTNHWIAGPVMDLWKSGKPEMKGPFRGGKKEGEFTFYYENGAIRAVGNYENDTRIGLWKYFYRNGKPEMEVEFIPVLGEEARINFYNDSTGNQLLKDGTGKWKQNITYSNGVRAIINGEFKGYARHGKWTYSVSDDKATREEEYENGTLKKAILKNTGGASRVKVEDSLPYFIYLTDKFLYIDNNAAGPGVDFKLYPFLPTMSVNRKVIYNPKLLSAEESNEIFTIVEEAASPQEGLGKFYQAIAQLAKQGKASGDKMHGKVFIEFVVEKDGSFTGIRVVKGVGGALDEEAVRVLQEYAKTHKWYPGKQHGKPVRMRFVLPLTF